MSQETIGVGNAANDGNGDPLRDAFIKVNNNFTDLFGQTGNIENSTANRRLIGDTATGSAEAGLTEIVILGGRDSFPNVIGSNSATIVGADFTPGATWGADAGYVASSAGVASIIGGYDQINNQSGATIVHSDHSHIQYDSLGHSCILGGSYNLISAGRSVVCGSRNVAIEGNQAFAGAFGTDGATVDASHSYVMGKDITCTGDYSIVVGRDVETAFDYSRVFGRDGGAPGLYTDTFVVPQLVEANDVRSWSGVYKKRTTDATLTNMDSLLNLPSGKVFAAVIKVSVVAMRDGSVDDGNGDSDYSAGAWEAEVLLTWDGTNGYIADLASQSGPSTSPTFNLTTIRDNITVGAVPHIAINTGALRPKVTGVASTIINWVAEMRVVSTLVS